MKRLAHTGTASAKPLPRLADAKKSLLLATDPATDSLPDEATAAAAAMVTMRTQQSRA
jgi:hypothetical protein